ncbi:MAG: carbamoyl phosphate synthase small subunit [Halobacteriovoraceae bacterium]|nr:carbamoyl phosphate synthase small subunit [Halobacteriovoraceae bacterium]|tara:strand:+ start:421 stop:1524 length:1104 start_codon:yes stop_codon:yes gene_type:complete
MSKHENIYLYLEDGTELCGKSFGHKPEKPIPAELVFNTSMWGYQEIFTDPSYCDQAIVMTYPLIGNYGINFDDNESITPHLSAVIVKEYCEEASNFRNEMSLSTFLQNKNVPGISDLDTRFLTKAIRKEGAMKCLISMTSLNKNEVEDLLKPDLRQDQIARVSTKAISHFPKNGGTRVVLIDFGFKKNILESLLKRDCDVFVVPYDTDFETIQDLHPQGIMLSNGPGDPKSIEKVIPTIQKLQDHYPLFSICMGHQIFALANGANTTKMKFGHRGANHPVKDFIKDRVYITSQNHGYCVDEASIAQTQLEVTQINLNDKTIEGLKHKTKPAFSVQYHPEASPGPNDTKYLFDDFMTLIRKENSHAQR